MRTCLSPRWARTSPLALATKGVDAIGIMVVWGLRLQVGHALDRSPTASGPTEFQGRASSVYLCVGPWAGSSSDRPLGGVIAQRWGPTAPFWFAAVGSGARPSLSYGANSAHIAHADAGQPAQSR